MSKNKPHIEFTKMSSEENWHTPKGYPTGIEQQILASDIDEISSPSWFMVIVSLTKTAAWILVIPPDGFFFVKSWHVTG